MITENQFFETSRFGRIEFAELDVVRFAEGILGFPDAKHFVLINHRPDGPFRWLQSLDSADLAFLVVDPANFVADYAPEMPKKDAQQLEINEDTARLVYTIVTIPKGKPEAMTINLAGPIVINAETRMGRQVVLEADGFSTKQPVLRESESETAAAA